MNIISKVFKTILGCLHSLKRLNACENPFCFDNETLPEPEFQEKIQHYLSTDSFVIEHL